jgi:hypothetical protein
MQIDHIKRDGGITPLGNGKRGDLSARENFINIF